MSNVRILLFADLRDLAGVMTSIESVPDGTTVEELFDRVALRWPAIRAARPTLRFAVGDEVVPPHRVLTDGVDVAFLPPFSGG